MCESSMISSCSERSLSLNDHGNDGVDHHTSYKPLLKAKISGMIMSANFRRLSATYRQARQGDEQIITKLHCPNSHQDELYRTVRLANLVIKCEQNQKMLNLFLTSKLYPQLGRCSKSS